MTFIPLAEETGLIVPIGEWVLREACVQLQRWIKAGLNSTTVAVNVSMLQLLRGELYTRLREIIEDFRIPRAPDRARADRVRWSWPTPSSRSRTLTQIKSLGVNVAIDDFGTGYSSLAYLKRLPIDTLKIDKEFVGDITTDPDDEAITATMITMAHSLGLDVIAEGVETPEQLDYLREQKCDEVQGNLISPPLDPERIFKLLLDRAAAFNERTRAASSTVREFPGDQAAGALRDFGWRSGRTALARTGSRLRRSGERASAQCRGRPGAAYSRGPGIAASARLPGPDPPPDRRRFPDLTRNGEKLTQAPVLP